MKLPRLFATFGIDLISIYKVTHTSCKTKVASLFDL